MATRYFRFNGESLRILGEFEEERKAANAKLKAWLESVGCTTGRFLGGDGNICGVAFAGKPPEGWGQCKRHPEFHRPYQRTREGKRLHAEMTRLKNPGAGRLASMLGLKVTIHGGFMYRTCGVAYPKEGNPVGCFIDPTNARGWPADAIEITAGEWLAASNDKAASPAA